jgi:hypothetical protein
MFAIAFDLVVAETAQNHPKGVSQAYADIGATLANFGFDRVQGESLHHAIRGFGQPVRGDRRLESATVAARVGARHPSVQGRAMVRFY